MFKWLRAPALLAPLVLGLCAAAPPAARAGCGADNPNCVVPTVQPYTESNNQAASTQFVQGAIAAAGTSGITAIFGDVAAVGPGSVAATLATVNANPGSYGSATSCVAFTVNAKGLITAASAATCTPTIGSIAGLGSGIAAWLATPTTANLAAALTDGGTGSGAAVFATAPTLVNPVVGTQSSADNSTKAASTGFVQSAIASIGSGSSASFATLTAATAASIGSPVVTVRTQGYTAANDGGGGVYNKLASPPGTPKAWNFQSADGAWWQLIASPVYPRQVGAVLDGSTDDAVAIQAWHDYGVAFGVVSAGQAGTAAIPTETINLASNANIDGLGLLKIQRQSNTDASLLDCNIANTSPQNNITVRGINFDTTAGFGSTSSNTVGLTTQNYTVPAGLVGLVVNQFVQITAVSGVANYEIAQINSYSGTTLNVTATTAVGSGTFANWFIDVYPHNGDLAASNIALRFTACTNILAQRNNFTGRFYNALDSRNGTNIIFDHNTVTGYVNRGIHMGAYLSGNAADNNQATFNEINGASFSQYGINTSASDAALGIRYLIHGNQIKGTTFQGIIIGGGVTYSQISNNSIQMAFNSLGVGIIAEQLVGSVTQQPSQLTISSNTVDSGQQGFFLVGVTYTAMTGNVAAGSGIGYELVGTGSTVCAYNTLVGNVAEGTNNSGFELIGGFSGGVRGNSVVGNTSTVNAGYGFLTDANTASNIITGNSALSNSVGGYSINGTGNVTSGNI